MDGLQVNEAQNSQHDSRVFPCQVWERQGDPNDGGKKGLGRKKKKKKNVSTEIRPDLVTKLSRGGDSRLSLGCRPTASKPLRCCPIAAIAERRQGGVRGSWAKF